MKHPLTITAALVAAYLGSYAWFRCVAERPWTIWGPECVIFPTTAL